MRTKSFIHLPANILFGGLLACSQLIAAEPEMTGKLDPNPSERTSPTNDVLTYGTGYINNQAVSIPKRYLRITNNSDRTVYPIIRAQNSVYVMVGDKPKIVKGRDGKDMKLSKYDPFDPGGVEYRGYIGYSDGKKFYYGLKKGDTIKIDLPVAFWDAARMGIETGSEYLLNNQDVKPNPLHNDKTAVTSIVAAEKGGGAIPNGVVMWSRAQDPTMGAPAVDTQDQLVEWTFRDHSVLTNSWVLAATDNQIPENQMLNLINFDVSNVDSLYLPVAAAPLDAWVLPQIRGDKTGKGWVAGSVDAPTGWTGAVVDQDFLKKNLLKFINNENGTDGKPMLGEYFAGKGWPYYNFPGFDPKATNSSVLPRIPSGATIFPQSSEVGSYYDDKTWQKNTYMLSSSGTGAIWVSIGASAEQDPAHTNVLVLAPTTTDEQMNYIQEGFTVVCDGDPDHKVIAPGTTVGKITDDDRKKRRVPLSVAKLGTAKTRSFTFANPSKDYVVDALVRLWFSWAEYYVKNWATDHPNAKQVANQKVRGILKPNTSTLTLTQGTADQFGLVEGMSVRGKGLDDAKTEVGEPHFGDAVILRISRDKKSLSLSQLATASATGKDDEFSFTPPGMAANDLFWKPKKAGDPGFDGYPLKLQFDLSRFASDPSRDPYLFSQQVYVVMAAMNQIDKKTNNNSVKKYMQDIIGANMGYIFTNDAKKFPDADASTAIIRDKIKSLLRGVTDFTQYPDDVDSAGKHLTWYPHPAVKHPGSVGSEKFNVFNLDPFVWFVHEVLKFSGYGFSIDDDTADIGADGTTTLQVSIAGPKELPIPHPWGPQAPFGPLKDQSCDYSGSHKGTAIQHNVSDASNASPIQITTTEDLTYLLNEGDQVVIGAVNGNNAANTKDWEQNDKQDFVAFKVGKVGKYTFELLNLDGSLTKGSGAYTSGGWWKKYPFQPYLNTGKDLSKVFYRVKGDDTLGTFLGTYVSVDGVDYDPTDKKKERFRVIALGAANTGQLILNKPLTDSSGNPLAAKDGLLVTFYGPEKP